MAIEHERYGEECRFEMNGVGRFTAHADCPVCQKPLPESARLAVEAVEEWAKGLCDGDLAAMAASPRPYGVSERTHKIARAELARREGR